MAGLSFFGRNLKTLRGLKGVSQKQLSDAIGVSVTTISGWEVRGVVPAVHRINSLCGFFECVPDDLLSDVNGAYARIHGLEMPPQVHAKLYGRVHAGSAAEPDVVDSDVPIPSEVLLAHPSGYFLQVEGTCMNRAYPEGCFVFIDPLLPPRDGSIAVVSIDGSDYIMRRLKLGKSTLMLVAESFDDSWEDMVFTNGDGHDVSMVGTVVWYQANHDLELR